MDHKPQAANSPFSGELFFVPIPSKVISTPIDKVAADYPVLASVAASFRSNVIAVSSMCSVPYFFGNWMLIDRQIQTLRLANSIEAGAHHAHGPERDEIDRQAYRRSSEEVIRKGALKYPVVVGALQPFADIDMFRSAVDELLRTGLVLVWSAFEVLASDLFALVLNSRPALVRRLNSDEAAKRLFGVKNLSLEQLEENAFDVSRAMGDLVLSQHAVDNVPSMKAAYFALCPDDQILRETLGTKELFVLNQKRNLIVHRRGIVDAEYKRRVQDETPLGEKIRVAASEVEATISLVRDGGVALLEAGARVMAANPAPPADGWRRR